MGQTNLGQRILHETKKKPPYSQGGFLKNDLILVIHHQFTAHFG